MSDDYSQPDERVMFASQVPVPPNALVDELRRAGKQARERPDQTKRRLPPVTERNRAKRIEEPAGVVPMSTDEWLGQLAWAWDKGHEPHGPVQEFGETPCDCRNPYKVS